MEIDIEKLREDMKQQCYAAFFVGGFGGALNESFHIDQESPDELIKSAQLRGIDLREYEIKRGDH